MLIKAYYLYKMSIVCFVFVQTECKTVITSQDPVFSRLEHHKLHEYARRKTYVPGSSGDIDSLKRKRGRPPKFPKNDIPLVPKVEMTDAEISLYAATHGEANSSIANGFQKYTCIEACPDDRCTYTGHEHFHCVRQRCHHVTDRGDVLALHANDFHGFVTITEGFEFFDRNVDCRRTHCHNNHTTRHFHCIRPKCDYSFVRYSTMAQHDRKHKVTDATVKPVKKLCLKYPSTLASTSSKAAPFMKTHNITSALVHSRLPDLKKETDIQHQKSQIGIMEVERQSSTTSQIGTIITHNSNSDGLQRITITQQPPVSLAQFSLSNSTYISVSTIPASDSTAVIQSTQMEFTPVLVTNLQPFTSLVNTASLVTMTPVTPVMVAPVESELKHNATQFRLISIAPKPDKSSVSSVAPSSIQHSGSDSTRTFPLSTLLQKSKSNTSTPQLDWLSMKMRMHYGMHQNCGRPFCKLKKRDHYHCFDCNQAFSDAVRLKCHVSRHGVKLEKLDTHDKVVTNISIVNPINKTISCEKTENDNEHRKDDDGSSSSNNIDNNEFILPASSSSAHLAGAAISDEDEDLADRLVIDLSASNDWLNTNGESKIEIRKQNCCKLEYDTADLKNDGKEMNIIADASRSPAIIEEQNRLKEFVEINEMPSIGVRVLSGASNEMCIAEEATPGGYAKFRFSEDCCQDRCAYRLSMTHYHCTRADCAYSFCDHSRFVQHNERHRRMDTVMGDRFQQFHGKMDCRYPDCEHANRRSTHFHCLICPFTCTDSSKVIAHRKHHSKMEHFAGHGFCKISVGDNCGYDTCSHRSKQTHYHCTVDGCHHVVIGPAQMAAHSVKHKTS